MSAEPMQLEEELLDAAIASGPGIEYTPELWEQKRREILQRLCLPGAEPELDA
jgi:hypothetical protein